ncbi:MFS transporter [uncultured Roseobacter sp.]|uniref:MFS transporter n=1 Tax=uncultured Roseobacter sp. TaxID=114847 RepID=UPI00260A127C|nr:MFS transporter [uncultured Roseobacter sp.]
MALLAKNRSFRLLFSATAVSNLGDGVSALAFPWLATLITRDPALVALVAFATTLPWLLFSVPVGVLVDRYDRRLLMVRADLFRLVLTCGVISLIFSVPAFPPDGDPLVYILALSALGMLLGTAEVVRDNAAQTVLPSVVAKSELETANGQLWSVEQVMGSFVGPPLAGLLIALAVPAPFALDAVTFGVAALLVWCIAIPQRPDPPRRKIWPEMVEGWQWMRGSTTIFRLAIMLGFINGISVMAMTILILFSQEVLGLSAAQHGIMMAFGAAGGVLGGVLGPRIIARIGGQRAVIIALVLICLPFVILSLTASPLVAAGALFIEVFSALMWNIVTVSYRQRRIPDALLGRVNALYRFFGWGMMPVGALLGGWIVTLAEPSLGRELALRLPFMFASAGAVLLLIYGVRKLRL